MGKSRKVASHAAHVASTEPRDLSGSPRDLHGLGLINWHTANTANKIIILHRMLNGQDGLANMVDTELWLASQQTGALGSMTSPPLLFLNVRVVRTDGGPAAMPAANMDRNGKIRRRHKRDVDRVHQTQGTS